MEALLIKYGYVILLAGVALEGEAFLLAASYLAHRGIIFSFAWVLVTAVIANCAADQIYYLIARTRGRRWLDGRFGAHPRYQKVLGLMHDRAGWLLLGSRFAFGFRIIIPAACGALGMPPLRFTLINIVAGVIWALPVGYLGYSLGAAAEKFIADFKRYELWVFIALLMIAAAVLLIRHLRRSAWIEDLVLIDIHTIAPFMIGAMGIVNLITAIVPHTHWTITALSTWLPLEVTQRSRPLMLFAGFALLQVTRNLARRKESAWWVAAVALALSLVLHITRALDLHHSLVAALLLGYLIYFRRRFYARSDPASMKLGAVMVPVMAATVFVYGLVGLFHLRAQFQWYPGADPINQAFRAGILILDPHVEPVTNLAARYLGSIQIAGWLARFYLLALFLRPVILRNRQEAPPDTIDAVFRAHGASSLSAFAVQNDKHHLLVAGGRGLIAYAVRGSVAVSCGDPLAPEDHFEASVRDYLDHCRKNGWTPCLYEASESFLPYYRALGLKELKVAEEAVLGLQEFNLAGGKRANLRAMVNKAAKSGMVVRRYNRKAEPDRIVDEQLEEISEQWLEEKSLGELGFTIGRFSLEALDGIEVFLAFVGNRLEAFCSWLPYRGGDAVVLDLMRKRKDAVAGTMDFLLAQSILQLKAAGFAEASLGNAPLANVTGPRGPLDRGVALLFEKMNSFYGYRNLFQFKKKFLPAWRGRYLIYPRGADLPKVVYALTAVHSSGGVLSLLRK